MKMFFKSKLLLFSILTFNSLLFFSCPSYSKPSQVDISSIYEILDYPNYNLEELKERFEKIQYEDGVWNFSGHAWTGDVGRSWVYNFYTPTVNSVYIWIYDNQFNAKNSFEWYRKNDHGRLRKKVINISDDIEIILWNSVMYRSACSFYVYNDQRHLYTCIRIGNVIYSFSEHFSARETKINGIPTSKNIEMICKALK